MSKRALLPAAIAAAFAVALMGGVAAPVSAQQGYDCAHGPDTWRVRGVASWDRLNIREHAGASSPIIGSISATASGVHCLGPCKGNWCRVSWRGLVGWVNMRFLGE